MMIRARRIWQTATICASVLISASIGIGCAGEGDGDTSDEVFDDIASVPETPEDAIAYEFPEQILEPGSEKQLCMFLEPTEEDIYFRRLDAYQGAFGHHLIFFRTIAPEEPGTVRDCTRAEDMKSLMPVMASVNFGLAEFPDGMAIRVEAGTQLVIQQHYLNTSDQPIRVRDVIHAFTLPLDEVAVLAGFLGLSDISYQIPPNIPDYEVAFDCKAPVDMNLLLIGPHMHEYGTKFGLSITDGGGAGDSIIEIDSWEAFMRDDPPVIQYEVAAPRALSKGDVIRTQCEFFNTTDHIIEFPEEMCATFGYYYPAPPGLDVWVCSGS